MKNYRHKTPVTEKLQLEQMLIQKEFSNLCKIKSLAVFFFDEYAQIKIRLNVHKYDPKLQKMSTLKHDAINVKVNGHGVKSYNFVN